MIDESSSELLAWCSMKSNKIRVAEPIERGRCVDFQGPSPLNEAISNKCGFLILLQI